MRHYIYIYLLVVTLVDREMSTSEDEASEGEKRSKEEDKGGGCPSCAAVRGARRTAKDTKANSIKSPPPHLPLPHKTIPHSPPPPPLEVSPIFVVRSKSASGEKLLLGGAFFASRCFKQLDLARKTRRRSLPSVGPVHISAEDVALRITMRRIFAPFPQMTFKTLIHYIVRTVMYSSVSPPRITGDARIHARDSDLSEEGKSRERRDGWRPCIQ